MAINRQGLKLKAREVISSSDPKVFNICAIYVALSALMSVLSAGVMGANMTQSDASQIMTYIEQGNFEYAAAYCREFLPPASSYIIDTAIQLVMTVVSAGLLIFLLNTVRKTSPCAGNLLDGFGMFFRLVWLSILEGLFILLWSCLFVIPGIIAAYKYRMAVYIMIDSPDMTAMECIRESKRMMQGRKMELFVLDLSFILWALMSNIAIIGLAVQLFSVPYLNMTYTLFYETLRTGEQPPVIFDEDV